MDIAAMWPIRQGNPDRVNYHTRYPIAEGVWDSFSHDVEGSVDVRIQAAPSARAKQPAFDPVASVDLVLADGFQARTPDLESVCTAA